MSTEQATPPAETPNTAAQVLANDPSKISDPAGGSPEAPGGDGGGNPATGGDDDAPKASFFEGLSDENKQLVAAKKWDQSDDVNLNTILDGYRNAEKLIGNPNAMEVPSAADPFNSPLWEKLGVPADATGYEVTRPEMPEGLAYDETLESKVLEAAAGVKMLPQQVNALVAAFADHQASQQEAVATGLKQQGEKALAALKSDWGAEFDGNVNVAKQAAAHLELLNEDGTNVLDALEGQLGMVPVTKLMHKIGLMLGEDVVKGGNGTGFGTTPEAAKAEIANLRLDSGFQKALNDRRDPGHQAAIEKRNQLYKIAYGT